MSDEIRLSGTTVNAPDALALARFYAELTGGVTGSIQGELLTLSLARLSLGELTVKQDTITGQVSAGLPVNLRRSK